MATKIILLLTLLAYSMIVSQSFMYIFALKDVQYSLVLFRLIGRNTEFQYRQVVNILGFVSLLVGAVFGAK